MTHYYVYKHRLQDTDRVFYIGKGHGYRAWEKYGRNQYWQNITKKHKYVVEIVQENLSESEAYQLERTLIAHYGLFSHGGTLCNMTQGGEGRVGFSWNGIRSSINNPMHGKKHTAEAKDKIAATKKDKPRPAHVIEALKKANVTRKGRMHSRYGKKHSAETKAKMSIKSKGRSKKASIILDNETGIYYIGWTELSKTLNLKIYQVEYLRSIGRLKRYIITK